MSAVRRIVRSRALAARASNLYACAMVSVLYLFLPFGGYERMMEGKYVCFLALTLGYLAAMATAAPLERPRVTAMRRCAAAYLACSALSALCSPYGARTLLGGSRREGLVTAALYVAVFFCLSRYLRADRRLLYLSAAAVTLCDALVLAQTAGYDPLRLYPAGLGYHDGDAAYAGFFAGTSGNVDFTAFLLALALCVFAAALVRLRAWTLAPVVAATLLALYRVDVAAAWVGLAFAAVWSPALLLRRGRGAALAASAALTAAALLFLRRYGGTEPTLVEASRFLRGDFDGALGSGRVAIWRGCLMLARERPLLGGGPDTLWLRGLEPLTWLHDGAAVPADITAAHNEYLGILVNQGAVALAAYLALLGYALARCFRRADAPEYAVCGAGLLCYGAMAMFSVSTCITAPYVWMLFALAQGDKIDC